MSYSLKYYPDPGIAFDIVRMLFIKLNPPSVWQELLTSIESSSQQTVIINETAALFPDPNTDLLLFTFLPANKYETFLSQIIRNMISNDFVSFSIEKLNGYLSNTNKITEELYAFYLGELSDNAPYSEYAIRTSKTIPDKIKLLLFGFIMDPLKYVSNLANTIEQYSNILKYSNLPYSSNMNISDSFIDSIITNSHNDDPSLKISLAQKDINYSICYTIPDFLCHFFDTPHPFLITASETIISFNPNAESYDTSSLFVYTNALSDMYRLSIIQLLLTYQSLTLQEISQHLNLSTTATYHHISLLKKANMLYTSYHGRTIHYSYNPVGVQDTIKILTSIQAKQADIY